MVNLELEFESKEYPCLGWDVKEPQHQEQTLELRMPEDLPDIGSILAAWGQCVLRSKQISGDEASVTGGVLVWVLYKPVDGSEPRSVEGWIPMQLKWSLAQGRSDGVIRACWNLRSVDVRMLTPRKMMLRAAVGVRTEVLHNRSMDICQPEQVPEDVQLLRRQYPAMVPKEAGEKTFQLEPVFSVPQESDMVQMVYCSVNPILREQKVMGNRAVFRGSLRCHVLYRGEDGRLQSTDFEEDFSQLEDLRQEYDKEAQLATMMELTGLEPELQDGQLILKTGLTAQYLVFDRCMMSVVEDAYSPVRDVTMRTAVLDVPMILDTGKKVLQPKVQISADNIADISVFAEPPVVRRGGDLAEMEFPGTLQVLHYDQEGKLACITSKWSESWELPMDRSARLDAAVAVTSVSSPGQPPALELEVQADTVCTEGITMLTGLELPEPRQPDPRRPSVVLCRTAGQSIWELAKANGSTVEAIYEANHLSEDPGQDRIVLVPIL